MTLKTPGILCQTWNFVAS